MIASLVQPLLDGPLDILGDIHGEIEALLTILGHLGYDSEGKHPEGRRLVFVGDLVDRGPDSPAVVEMVRRLVEAERAQAVLGNHEFNIFAAKPKPDNAWFFHHGLPPDDPAARRPQVRADARTCARMLDFFARLPLALERPDLRVVHACWDESMIAIARQATDAIALHRLYQEKIEVNMERRGLHGPARRLARQNEDPVKLLTSGLETRAEEPFEVMGRLRHERRAAWWNSYGGPLCVVGHYWRILLADEVDGDRLFTNVPRDATLGRGDAMCIDYSVGKRFRERMVPGFDGTYQTRLAALRFPERVLIFDNGERCPLRQVRPRSEEAAGHGDGMPR